MLDNLAVVLRGQGIPFLADTRSMTIKNEAIHPAVSLGIPEGATTCSGCTQDKYDDLSEEDDARCSAGHYRPGFARDTVQWIRPDTCIAACAKQATAEAVEPLREAVIVAAKKANPYETDFEIVNAVAALRRAAHEGYERGE